MAQTDSSMVAGKSVEELRQHRLLGDDRDAEIAVQHVADIVGELRQSGRSRPISWRSSACRSGRDAALAARAPRRDRPGRAGSAMKVSEDQTPTKVGIDQR